MHVAIIMDGNGRWAGRRNLNRPAGHRAGVKVAEAVVRAAARHGVNTLTLYAFSRSEEHTSELQSRFDLVCRLLLEKKKKKKNNKNKKYQNKTHRDDLHTLP